MTAVQLNIPYRSQWARDAGDHSADCGPTCVAMMLNGLGIAITPNQMYEFIGPKGKKDFTSIQELRKAAFEGGRLTLTRQQYANDNEALDQLRQNLDKGQAMIALICYKPWRAITGIPFSGGHFVLVTGYDEAHVYVHDPLFGWHTDMADGEFYSLTHAQFLAGWGSGSLVGNPNYVCLISDVAFPFLTESAERSPDPIEIPAINDLMLRRILSLAAYEGEATPNLDDAETAVQWLERVQHWGNQMDVYIVQSGDTMSRIAKRYYRDAGHWRAIQKFNDLTNSILFVGQLLRIPLPDPTYANKKTGPRTPAVEDPSVHISSPAVAPSPLPLPLQTRNPATQFTTISPELG